MLNNWVVMPTCLPTVLRRCRMCTSERFRPNGKFRVNAHHKLLDAWLLALCTACGDTAKLTLLERVNVRSIRPELLDRMHDNDPALAAELLQDPAVRRRNRIALDWDNAWRLDTGGPDHLDREGGFPCSNEAGSLGKIDVSVRFAARIPVRPVRLIAEGCGLSRAEVERLITEGKLVSAVRLSGKLSGDFTFLLKR
ncbi:DUF1062 domain-containing protein [Streptomyces platensis]|uniref:DUF1062 domain-containing protein n=1 Tax=Streptomyces platensis TaxID=58346 RepID=UPI002E8205E2|nr:DUF1062 domain-containing protein [Streptomyces platensis]WTI52650.1 DUF1062 domain-containing protein [Streptomyces platensis]WUB81712.1 DUF1062 domain-containing protein [Streptomyces platensis]